MQTSELIDEIVACLTDAQAASSTAETVLVLFAANLQKLAGRKRVHEALEGQE